jgi:hypothetical protein
LVTVLGSFLKEASSVLMPVEKSLPVVGHLNVRIPIIASHATSLLPSYQHLRRPVGSVANARHRPSRQREGHIAPAADRMKATAAGA